MGELILETDNESMQNPKTCNKSTVKSNYVIVRPKVDQRALVCHT